MCRSDRYWIVVVLTVVFLYFSVASPGSLNVDRSAYVHKYVQLKIQYKWLTPSLFETVWWKGKMFDVKPGIICAFVDAESWGNPKAVSRSDARGLMQVMPYMYKRIVSRRGDTPRIRDLFKPNVNVFAGTLILRDCLNAANGNVILAAKLYNAGNIAYFNGPYIIAILESLAITYPDQTMRETLIPDAKIRSWARY